MPRVILVDENDTEIGTEEKIKAHEKGLLHRAFSIFIFNSKKELLLQQRALSKYHSAGLWTNTCCSHPSPNELTLRAAHRRLQEEMGFDTDLKELFSFTYNVAMQNGLIEHEFDHVFLGFYEGKVVTNPAEVERFLWINRQALEEKIKKEAHTFTPWFLLCYSNVMNYLD